MSNCRKYRYLIVVISLVSSCCTPNNTERYDFSFEAEAVNRFEGCSDVNVEFYRNMINSARVAYKKNQKPILAASRTFQDNYGDIRDIYYIYGIDDQSGLNKRELFEHLETKYGFLIFEAQDTCMAKGILYGDALPVYNKEVLRLGGGQLR